MISIILSLGKSVKTVEANFTVHEDKINFKGIYFAEERVVHEGDVKNIGVNFKNGEKVSKGARISSSIISPEAGILLFNIDGYENRYTIGNIKDVDVKAIDELIVRKTLKPGIKILNNSQWYLCASVAEEMDKSLPKGSEKEIFISNKYYKAVVADKFKNTSGYFVILKMKDDMDITNLQRGFTGYIVKAKQNGVSLPASAVVELNGEKGIFVEKNGYAYFRKVKLFTVSEDNVVVYSDPSSKTVLEYDKVIVNPSGLESGDKVR
jgi:putative membrane fusion protein